MAGAGVALLVGGAAFGLRARSASNELAGLGDGATWNQALYDSGKAAQRDMYILVAAGGAAVIGGGLAYVAGRRAAAPERAALAPTPLPGGGAGIAFTTGW
jgi:hypothetical protein